MKVLLDAGVIAAAVKGRLPVVLKLAQLKPGDVAVSVISQVQAEVGLRSQPRAQARFGKLQREFFESVRVLEFGSAEAQQASTLGSYLAQSGESLGGFELILAATALAHRLVLVTDRTSPYLHVPGLEVEKWM